MDIKKYNFFKFKAFLTEPEVTISEFYELPYHTELYGKPNLNGAWVLPSYNGIYAGLSVQTEFDDVVSHLCNEIDNNCTYPISREYKIEYLKEVMTYCEEKLEKIILKEVNTTYEYDPTFVNYKGVLFEDFYVAEKLQVYYQTTRMIYESLRYVEDLILIHLNKLKATINQDTTQRKPRKELDSFLLRDSLRKNKELMANLKEALIDAKFISSNTKIENFRTVFENKPVEEPIMWIGDKGALKLFISKLRDDCFSSEVTDIWKIAAKCFVYSGGKTINPEEFHSTHEVKPDTKNGKNIFYLMRMINNAKHTLS
jgi:hypothetical protein